MINIILCSKKSDHPSNPKKDYFGRFAAIFAPLTLSLLVSLATGILIWHITEKLHRQEQVKAHDQQAYSQLLSQAVTLIELLSPTPIHGTAPVLSQWQERAAESWIEFEKLYWASLATMNENGEIKRSLQELHSQLLTGLSGFSSAHNNALRSHKSLYDQLSRTSNAIRKGLD